MHYFLKSDLGETLDNAILSGILYDKSGNIVESIFDPGKSLKDAYEKQHFTIVVDEKESTKGNWPDKLDMFVTDAGNIFIAF